MYCIYELIIKIMLHHDVCVIMHNYIITLIQFCQITHSVPKYLYKLYFKLTLKWRLFT